MKIEKPMTRKEMAEALKTDKTNEITRLQINTEYLMNQRARVQLGGKSALYQMGDFDKLIQGNKDLINEHTEFCKHLDLVISEV